MHRIDTPTAQADKFGPGKNGFTGGNPQTGELPTALDADFFDSIQEELSNVIEGAGIVLKKAERNQLMKALTALTPGRLLNVQTLTQSGTYTKTPGTNLIFVRLWGAGGGGGNTSVVGGGGSGAGGGYCEGIFDASYFNTTTFIVGLGGVAVAGNTQANGGSGGRTQFGNLIGASGGGGGGSIATGGIPDLGANRLAVYGQSGQGSQGGIGGVGGATFGSFGGLPHASSTGDAGSFPGGGGAGGTKIATSQYFASGAGANGLIIIEEYS